MEFEDLKRAWEECDMKLDMSIHLNTRLLHTFVLGKAETSMKRLSRLLWIELLFNLAAVVWLGSFIWDHARQLRFVVPAVALDLGVIALTSACIRQIVAISEIDYGGPIVAIQKRLESLRVDRIRTTMWTFLLSPLVWVPLFIVGLKWLLNLDIYAMFSVVWLAANVVFGFVMIALGRWIARHYGARMNRSSLVQSFLQDIAGHSLTAATRFLHSLSQFEKDERGTV